MDVPTKETFSALSVPEQIAHLTRVDAKTRQEFILAARNSLDLARTLSSELFFYTLKEIGLTDAGGLLALAAPEQVRDMIDLDCWRGDQLDDQRLVHWLMLLEEASSSKLAEWFLCADIELLIVLMKRYFEVVRKADVEEDLNFDQTRYFTLDDQYLLRFVREEEPILHLLLERLRVLDYPFYKNVLEQSLFEIESGLEEEAFRWRTARLADRGYPDFNAAREVFHFVPPESIRLDQYLRSAFRPLQFAAEEDLTPPDHALTLLNASDSFFVQVLSTLPAEILEQLGTELAYLTNRIAIAEACDLGELAEVRRCAELAHDYLNLGLAYVSRSEEAEAGRLLLKIELQPFFQIGWSLVLRLQQRAKQLGGSLREAGILDWESYVDTPFREAWTGMQRRVPLFFRGLETPGEVVYRRFQTVPDIARSEAVLTAIPVWFTVLRRWGLLPDGPAPEGVTLAVVWNTAFARWVVAHRAEVRPLSRTELITVQKELQGTALEEKDAAFLALAAAHLKLTSEEREALAALAAHAREQLQATLRVDLESADVRFIGGLLIAG